MALFQPFVPTKRGVPSNLTAAVAKQGELDAQYARDNAARSAATQDAWFGGIDALANEYKTPRSPIGEYLRKMTGADVATPDSAGVAGQASEMGTDLTDQTGVNIVPDPIAEANVAGNPTPTLPKFDQTPDATQLSDAVAPPDINVADRGGSMRADITNSMNKVLDAQNGVGTATDVGGAVGDVTNATAGVEGASDAAEIAGDLSELTEGLDTGLQGVEAVSGATDALAGAGSNILPGVGAIASAANGDGGKAAAQLALSLLPPPFNMLGILGAFA